MRGVARAQIRANLRAAGLKALERAMRRRVLRARESVSYPRTSGNYRQQAGSAAQVSDFPENAGQAILRQACDVGGAFADFLGGLGVGVVAAAVLTPLCKKEPKLNPFASNGVQVVSPQVLDVLADLAGFGSSFGAGTEEGPIARGQREELARRLAGALSARFAPNTNSEVASGGIGANGTENKKNTNSTPLSTPTPTPARAFSEAVARLQAAFREAFPAFAANTVLSRLKTELEAQADRYARIQYGPQAFGPKSFSCPDVDVRL